MKKKKFELITVTVTIDNIVLQFTNEHHPQLISRYTPEGIGYLLKAMCKAAGEPIEEQYLYSSASVMESDLEGMFGGG